MAVGRSCILKNLLIYGIVTLVALLNGNNYCEKSKKLTISGDSLPEEYRIDEDPRHRDADGQGERLTRRSSPRTSYFLVSESEFCILFLLCSILNYSCDATWDPCLIKMSIIGFFPLF